MAFVPPLGATKTVSPQGTLYEVKETRSFQQPVSVQQRVGGRVVERTQFEQKEQEFVKESWFVSPSGQVLRHQQFDILDRPQYGGVKHSVQWSMPYAQPALDETFSPTGEPLGVVQTKIGGYSPRGTPQEIVMTTDFVRGTTTRTREMFSGEAKGIQHRYVQVGKNVIDVGMSNISTKEEAVYRSGGEEVKIKPLPYAPEINQSPGFSIERSFIESGASMAPSSSAVQSPAMQAFLASLSPQQKMMPEMQGFRPAPSEYGMTDAKTGQLIMFSFPTYEQQNPLVLKEYKETGGPIDRQFAEISRRSDIIAQRSIRQRATGDNLGLLKTQAQGVILGGAGLLVGLGKLVSGAVYRTKEVVPAFVEGMIKDPLGLKSLLTAPPGEESRVVGELLTGAAVTHIAVTRFAGTARAPRGEIKGEVNVFRDFEQVGQGSVAARRTGEVSLPASAETPFTITYSQYPRQGILGLFRGRPVDVSITSKEYFSPEAIRSAMLPTQGSAVNEAKFTIQLEGLQAKFKRTFPTGQPVPEPASGISPAVLTTKTISRQGRPLFSSQLAQDITSTGGESIKNTIFIGGKIMPKGTIGYVTKNVMPFTSAEVISVQKPFTPISRQERDFFIYSNDVGEIKLTTSQKTSFNNDPFDTFIAGGTFEKVRAQGILDIRLNIGRTQHSVPVLLEQTSETVHIGTPRITTRTERLAFTNELRQTAGIIAERPKSVIIEPSYVKIADVLPPEELATQITQSTEPVFRGMPRQDLFKEWVMQEQLGIKPYSTQDIIVAQETGIIKRQQPISSFSVTQRARKISLPDYTKTQGAPNDLAYNLFYSDNNLGELAGRGAFRTRLTARYIRERTGDLLNEISSMLPSKKAEITITNVETAPVRPSQQAIQNFGKNMAAISEPQAGTGTISILEEPITAFVERTNLPAMPQVSSNLLLARSEASIEGLTIAARPNIRMAELGDQESTGMSRSISMSESLPVSVPRNLSESISQPISIPIGISRSMSSSVSIPVSISRNINISMSISQSITQSVSQAVSITRTQTATTQAPFVFMPPIPFITPPPTPSKKKKKEATINKAFDVYVRRYGKLKKIASGLPRGKALQIGSEKALKTLAATFKLRPAGQTVQEDVRFVPDTSKFRTFAVRKGQQVPLEDTFIQRARYRLSDVGERSEIRAAKTAKERTGSFFGM